MMNDDSIMLYIHVPFCVRKCDYCDFVSFACNDDVKKRYFENLNKQIIDKAYLSGNRKVSSVFIGGGTPSCVDAAYIDSVLETARKCFSFAENPEITIEANPNSLKKESLAIYKNAGINRLSIGLQSADADELKLLSRLHTYEEFLEAFDAARCEGFDNINVDLMSGLPGQTVEKFLRTLSKVTKLEPEHISAYSLIIEPGTVFYERYNGRESLLDENTDRDIYHETCAFLKSMGYDRYEISNYSKSGKQCRHNTGYWKRRDYLGFGISAASLCDGKRYAMHTDISRYLQGDFSEEITVLDEKDCMDEFMFLGLRLTEGISKEKFYDCFKVSWDSLYAKTAEKLHKMGLLSVGERVFLTEKGMDVANYCMSEFLL